MTSCLFCNIADGHAVTQDRPENVVLYESEHFYVKPALGQFVEGYCLIVSKEHARTMSELSPIARDELAWLLKEIGSRLSAIRPGGQCVFEHGSACPQNHAGTCIDHAHVHLLPVSCDVRPELVTIHGCILTDSAANYSTLDSVRGSYLYYEAREGVGEVYSCAQRLPSQLMRKLICNRLGIPTQWDWRKKPRRDVVEEFVNSWRYKFGTPEHADVELPLGTR